MKDIITASLSDPFNIYFIIVYELIIKCFTILLIFLVADHQELLSLLENFLRMLVVHIGYVYSSNRLHCSFNYTLSFLGLFFFSGLSFPTTVVLRYSAEKRVN